MDIILTSPRLIFRKITQNDFDSLCEILQDKETMYAWEHGFTKEEVQNWMNSTLARYEKNGFGHFAAIEKETGALIGLIGPLMENIEGENCIGIGYILGKKYWKKGYGIEGAKTCMDYAFNTLKADKIVADIRHNNTPSRNIAEKLGMKIKGEFVKHYYGIDMPHLIYVKTKE